MPGTFPSPGLDRVNTAITITLSLFGLFLILAWFQVRAPEPVALRIAPPADALSQSLAVQKTNLKGTFTRFAGTPASLTGSWGQFRGNAHDNVAPERPGLQGRLEQAKLPILWSQKLGEGYAGAAIAGGCVYVLDYDKETQSDALRCFSLDKGEEIWRRAYRIPIKRNHGISRTVPAIGNGAVVTLGPKCHVLCADAKTGDYRWGLDLAAQYGTEVPLWYTGQCPLIDKDLAVLAPGGSALLIGVDLHTGKTRWKTPNPGKWKMSHSSVMPMTFFNRQFYVYCAIGGMVGVAADGPDQGQVLWQTQAWNHSVISPSPVQLPGNRILVTAGYGAGSKIFELRQTTAGYSLEEVLRLDKEVFACEQHTPIYYEGLVYTVLPNDAGEYNRQLVCMTPEGKLRWRSGREHRFGLGPFVIAGGKLFILDDQGVLTIAETGGTQYRQLSQTRVLQGRESWAPIAITGNLMVLRDFETMICLDLQQ